MRTTCALLFALALSSFAPLAAAQGAKAVTITPAPDGRFGAWLVAGPFRPPAPPKKGEPPLIDWSPPGVDETKQVARTGGAIGDEGRTWQAAASDGWGLDLRGSLGATTKDKDLIAYAGVSLHVTTAGRYHLLLGASDGIRVYLDGKSIFTHDGPRAQRDDDDLIALDLRAGTHSLLVKLRRYEGPMILRARVLDAAWGPPAGVAVQIPGASADDAERMARRLSSVTVDRGLTENGYEPRVLVRFPEGIPSPAPVRVSARVLGAAGELLGSVAPAVVPVEGPRTGEVELALPPLEGAALSAIEDKNLTIEVDVAGRIVKAPFYPRKATRLAVRRALFALNAIPDARPDWLRPGSHESIDHLRRRLLHLASRGDADAESQAREAKELDAAAARLESAADPYDGRTGFLRRAYRSAIDGELAPYGLYVPESFKRGERRTYPLIVVLHGLNGKPMAMLRWFFGGDDPKRDQDWEDRHHDGLPLLDAFVLAPNGHGNAMYRHLGQEDVMRAIDEVLSIYPIDVSRLTVTGPSMGGTGAALVALRRPDRFAASAPLCGYHSVFVRRDTITKTLRPWEKFLAEERSNASWAPNGRELPLFIVHGTQDLPVENSGVLIERYESLKYPIVHEHPALGHNVWQPTYEGLKGAKWLLGHTRDVHPRAIRYRTARARDGRIAWAEITELAASDTWGEVDARIRTRSAITITTRGVDALQIERDDKLLDVTAPLEITIDNQKLTFSPDTPAQMFRDGEIWTAGRRPEGARPRKRGHVTGPLRDVFHEPILFVYGASDPEDARVNEEVARAFARVRYGVEVRYPIMSDREFLARGEPLANERALFLVGAAHSNELVRALEPDLPIAVAKDAVTVGGKRIDGGGQVGAAFIHPNPKRPDRYVVIVAGTTPLGTWRALSLPELLPDYVVYDQRLAPARGQNVLGAASVPAAGFFKNDWSL